MTRLIKFWKPCIRSLATVVDKQITNKESMSLQNKILKWARTAIDEDKPHFKVGNKQLFFPKARIILLRPNAKHTPYQAKFIVPKSFNKLDLRDYLFHIYGLRAMNITTQLLHARYRRYTPMLPRYREPQIKKMTIDMAEPFIWPNEPENKDPWNYTFTKELDKLREDKLKLGSDVFKPSTAFDGVLGPYKPKPQPFVPKFLKEKMINQNKRITAKRLHLKKLVKVNKYANV